MFHSRFCLTYIQGGFRNAALQEVLKELMATKQQPPVDLDSKYISEQGDPVDDQQDGPARYALYDTRLSAMLATKQEIDSDLPRIIAEEQNDKVPSGVGVTYTRLGSDKCRSGAELVYEGVVAGTHYSQKGGGSNYICLPEDPEYSSTFRGGFQGYSILYGTEYEAPLRGEVHDHNIPCAVCYTPKRSSTVMIPAMINCPKSYTKEYDGYLMSDNKGHWRTEFVCVDKAMDVARGTHSNTNGALMYHVEVDCNTGIDCFPYRHDRELACVVCSR